MKLVISVLFLLIIQNSIYSIKTKEIISVKYGNDNNEVKYVTASLPSDDDLVVPTSFKVNDNNAVINDCNAEKLLVLKLDTKKIMSIKRDGCFDINYIDLKDSLILDINCLKIVGAIVLIFGNCSDLFS